MKKQKTKNKKNMTLLPLNLSHTCIYNMLNHKYSKSSLPRDAPSSSLKFILVRWTNRTNACTTSDIGGRNSGSD